MLRITTIHSRPSLPRPISDFLLPIVSEAETSQVGCHHRARAAPCTTDDSCSETARVRVSCFITGLPPPPIINSNYLRPLDVVIIPLTATPATTTTAAAAQTIYAQRLCGDPLYNAANASDVAMPWTDERAGCTRACLFACLLACCCRCRCRRKGRGCRNRCPRARTFRWDGKGGAMCCMIF